MAVRSTLPTHPPLKVREILRGLPTATGYTVTVKPLRYREELEVGRLGSHTRPLPHPS